MENIYFHRQDIIFFGISHDRHHQELWHLMFIF